MRFLTATVVGLVGAGVLAGAQSAGRATDWPSHGRDAGAVRFSPLKQINTQNVSQLQLGTTNGVVSWSSRGYSSKKMSSRYM